MWNFQSNENIGLYNLDKICKNKTKNQEIRRKKADSFGQMNEKEVIIKKSLIIYCNHKGNVIWYRHRQTVHLWAGKG